MTDNKEMIVSVIFITGCIIFCFFVVGNSWNNHINDNKRFVSINDDINDNKAQIVNDRVLFNTQLSIKERESIDRDSQLQQQVWGVANQPRQDEPKKAWASCLGVKQGNNDSFALDCEVN